MSLLVGENIVKNYAAQQVLRRISFRIEDADRIGLVGPNGEGKTTLLRILAALEEPTLGALERKKGLRLGYLPQKPEPLEGVSLWEFLKTAFADLLGMERELAAGLPGTAWTSMLSPEPAGDQAEALRRFSELQGEFEARGGYAYETRMKAVLTGLGFPPERYATPVDHLSGGERTRALLGRLLLEDAELLLLDEPTNHLDLQALEWLENWLKEFPGALLIVSHDRYFLDQIARRTWELSFGGLEAFRGNYTAYRATREERREERMRQWKAQEAYVARTEEFVRRHLAGQRSKEAQGRRTRLERFLATEAIPKPREHRRIHIRFAEPDRGGEKVLELRRVAAGYAPAEPLVRLPDLEVWRGQRIAVVGANGTGKTTLLRTILDDLPPLEGQVRRGAGLKAAYLAQVHDGLDPEATVLDSFRAAGPKLTEEEARTGLGALLFSGDDVFKKIGTLSGGERSRVALARIAAAEPNLLLLDEPTNHLDIPSQEALQDVLSEFPGTLIFVSHDRYLVQALATHLWIMDGGGLAVLEGKWDEYLRWREAHAAAPGAVSEAKARQEETRQAERRAAQRHRKEIERLTARQRELEAEITQREQELKELGEAITRAGEARKLDEVRRLGEAYKNAEAALKRLWDEWTHVGEALEKAQSATGSN